MLGSGGKTDNEISRAKMIRFTDNPGLAKPLTDDDLANSPSRLWFSLSSSLNCLLWWFARCWRAGDFFRRRRRSVCCGR